MTSSIVAIGSKLKFSKDNVTFTALAQLYKASPQGSKQTIVDQTNILTDPGGDAPLATRVVGGEIDLEGVLSPQDGSQLELGQLHIQRTLVWWQLLLSDGITLWTFQALVSEFVPFNLPGVAKMVIFSAKLRLSGPYIGPAGAV